MTNVSLAIVIPAYKDHYLRRTLDSLAKQTCRDFVVYVGDDSSPYNIKDIVNEFNGVLNINYTRFKNNLGGNNLVAQWQRCIDLVADEEWVCLFSDDDMMEQRCIECFYKNHLPQNVNLLHYNIKMIDERDNILRECDSFSPIMSSQEFYYKLFRHQIDARMPEFIFRRSSLELVEFDLAWRSDTATVMQAALSGGLYTISSGIDDCVLWRASSNNISGNRQLVSRKNNANIDFFCWVNAFFKKNQIEHPFSHFYQLKTIVFALEYNDWKDFLNTGFKLIKRYTDRRISTIFWVCSLLIYRLIYRQFELRRIQ